MQTWTELFLRYEKVSLWEPKIGEFYIENWATSSELGIVEQEFQAYEDLV